MSRKFLVCYNCVVNNMRYNGDTILVAEQHITAEILEIWRRKISTEVRLSEIKNHSNCSPILISVIFTNIIEIEV